MHDVAILDDILLTLDSHLPGLLDGGFTAVVDEVLKLDHLGTDEALLEVRVNGGCRTGCLAPPLVYVQARTSCTPAVK